MVFHQNKGARILSPLPRAWPVSSCLLSSPESLNQHQPTSVDGIFATLPGMRLLLRTATVWPQASSRLPLNLVPFCLLARPFALVSTIIPHIKHLHDDTKKPGSALGKELKGSHAHDKLELEAKDLAANSESNLEYTAPEAPEDNAESTAIQKGKKWEYDPQRAARLANLAEGFEAQRAAGFPNLQRARETQRAAGFPILQKVWEAQRVANSPNLQKARSVQRAQGFPHLKKAVEEQRAANFPRSQKQWAAQRAAGFLNMQKGLVMQRARGFPNLKQATENQRAAGFP
jgi:hypothetical protein